MKMVKNQDGNQDRNQERNQDRNQEILDELIVKRSPETEQRQAAEADQSPSLEEEENPAAEIEESPAAEAEQSPAAETGKEEKRKEKSPRGKKTRSKRRKKENGSKEEFKRFARNIWIALGSVLAAAIIWISVLVLIGYQSQRKKMEEQAIHPRVVAEDVTGSLPEEAPLVQLGENILDHIIQAGQSVVDALKSRPPSVLLTEGNKNNFASIDSCLINGKTGRVEVTVSAEGLPESDDKYYYLFALDTYDTNLSEEDEYIVREYKDQKVAFSVNLNYKMTGSRLFKKFVVAIRQNEMFIPVSGARYITNPEAIARYTAEFPVAVSKKGLLVDPNKLRGNELDDLGVKQAAYNIPVGRILGQTTHGSFPTIHYQYNGKTYSFNGQVISEYDLVFGTLAQKGITVTAILLNDYNHSYPQMIHPKARSGGTAPYFAFNGAEEAGVECMAAIGTFLAERYSGNTGNGRVSSWVIANEVNARKEWNHMEKLSISEYTEEYAKAVRVFYTAIKSVTANARIYISLDQQWDRNLANNTGYDGRDILDEFNRNVAEKGDIEWGLALHPYSVPLTNCKFWSSSKYVSHTASTSMMTMNNISVLTDYLQQSHFLTEKGEVRSIVLSELGYTANGGEALQAAAFAYAYYVVENNRHIDSFLLNRQTDAGEEVVQGLTFGLNTQGGQRRQLYQVFKYIDTPEHEKHTEFAKGIIGISDWSQVIAKR